MTMEAGEPNTAGPRGSTTGQKRTALEKVILFIAQGFGTGCVPLAPGTFGTAAGFLWIWLLLLPGNVWIYLAGIVAGFFFAVWIGHRAEKILGLNDPGSIVIDEIAALPLAFFPAVLATMKEQTLRPFTEFWRGNEVMLPVLAFFLFRFFDVAKPLGIKQSQNLPNGWGLVIDDFLAAILAATGVAVYLAVRR
jgi:phosphatidylglycerophosphatase A